MALGAIEAMEAAGLKPGTDIKIVSVDAIRAAFDAMIAGKLNATVECNPLLGPQLMTSVTEVVAGRPIPKRSVVDEQVFTMETAKQHIQSRKY
jgi:galactofuranose transport system substrate-binding protein